MLNSFSKKALYAVSTFALSTGFLVSTPDTANAAVMTSGAIFEGGNAPDTDRLRIGQSVGDGAMTIDGVAVGSDPRTEVNVIDTDGNGAFAVIGKAGNSGTLSLDDGKLLLQSPGFSGLWVGDQLADDSTLLLENGSDVTVRTTSGSIAFIVVGQDYATGTYKLDVIDSTLTLESTGGGSASIDLGIRGGTSDPNGPGGRGFATFSGATTQVTLDGDGGDFTYFSVGTRGTSEGSLTVTNEATLTINDGYFAVAGRPDGDALADPSQATGIARVTNGGQIVVNGIRNFPDEFAAGEELSIQIGSANPDPTGGSDGTLFIGGGLFGTDPLDTASVTATHDVWVGSRGATNGSTSAKLTVSNGGSLNCRTLFVGAGAAVNGNGGKINCDTIVRAGGKIKPGRSPGELDFASLTLEEGSILDIELLGSGQDKINVLGDLTINGAFDLNLTFDTLFAEGTSFDILNALNLDDDLFAAFLDKANINLFGVGNASNVSLEFGREGIRLTVDNLAPIPLPAAGWLLLAGLGVLAARRRR